jgi:hypothetical protein
MKNGKIKLTDISHPPCQRTVAAGIYPPSAFAKASSDKQAD